MAPGQQEPGGEGGTPAGAPEKLTEDAERALRDHVAALAERTRERHGTLTADGIEAFLADSKCVRRPHRLVFGDGDRAPHQFAQPGVDPDGGGHALWLHPALRDRPDLLPLAVAYLVPVINYGENVASDDLCLEYTARLFGWDEDECYRRLCALAEELELSVKRREEDAG